jgi:hypothetical protein
MGLNIPKNKKDRTKVDQYNYIQKKVYDIEMGWQDTWKQRRHEALNYKFETGQKREEFHNTAYPYPLAGDKADKSRGINAQTRKDVIEYFDSIRPEVPKKPLYKVNLLDQREIKNINMEPQRPGIKIDEKKYKYNKYYDSQKKEYRVTILDKSKKRKNMNIQIVDDISLDQFKVMYKK